LTTPEVSPAIPATNSAESPPRWTRLKSHWYRWLAGLHCLILGYGPLASTTHRALALAVVILGFFIISHSLLDLLWRQLPTGQEAAAMHYTTKTYTRAFQGAATALITVPGVLLGLLAIFGKPPFPLALKVAAASLVISLVLSIVLLSYASLEVPLAKWPLLFLGVLTNLILWSLTLGLLCIMTVLFFAT
jgi:hypothetical protein